MVQKRQHYYSLNFGVTDKGLWHNQERKRGVSGLALSSRTDVSPKLKIIARELNYYLEGG